LPLEKNVEFPVYSKLFTISEKVLSIQETFGKKVILASSNEDSLIVDPFGGSGTTFAVAETFNRKWLGSELNSEYCEIIKARLPDKEHIERILNGKDEEEAVKRRERIREPML
jgi:DNA modification methylase